MTKTYRIEQGLIIDPERPRCAGYIFAFGAGKAHDPRGPVILVEGRTPTAEEIATHNAIVANGELQAAIASGKALLYLTVERKDPCDYGPVYEGHVGNWISTWRAPWCYIRKSKAAAFGGPIDCYHVWFTGPDGAKWYGVNKGHGQILRARRLKADA